MTTETAVFYFTSNIYISLWFLFQMFTGVNSMVSILYDIFYTVLFSFQSAPQTSLQELESQVAVMDFATINTRKLNS